MGVEVQLRLFDREAYARLVDARRQWHGRRDAAALIDVLREALAKMRACTRARADASDDPPGPRSVEETDLEDAIAVLADPASTPRQAEEAVSRVDLVQAQSIAWDHELRADVGLGRGELPRWFTENSAWLGAVVAGGGVSGEVLELATQTRLFTREDVVRFRDELARLPSAPGRPLGDHVARVRHLVEIALSDSHLALGLSVG